MSSIVDEDTARAVDAGRETAASVLASVQYEAKKVFLVFVAVFLAAIFALRLYVWDFLEANTKSQMTPEVREELDIIAVTPFDVILMQVKIGLIFGAIAGAIVALYLARTKILERVEQTVEVTAPRLYGFVLVAAALAFGGMLYAYGAFFPLMFKVLAEQAHYAQVKPSYSIVEFTQFLLLLTLSFGLAAQLPLLMGMLSYTEIVPYETFRDKWRYAVLGIFVFGAVFSPPDPFTQILWAIPLMTLYAFSLGVAKVVTNIHRAGAQSSPVDTVSFRQMGVQLGVAVVLGFVCTVVAFASGLAVDLGAVVFGPLPTSTSLPYFGDVALPVGVEQGELVDWLRWGGQVAVLVGGLTLLYHLQNVLRMPIVSRQLGPTPTAGDPEELDLSQLDAAGVRAAPPEAFESLSEDEAVQIAGEAMEAGDDEKGKLLLQRWEEIDQGAAGDADVNLRTADAETIREAPPAAFAAIDEERAIEIAGEAMEAGDDERGKLILQRWEEVDQMDEVPEPGGDGESDPTELDLETASAEAIEAAHPAAFADLSEDEAIDVAGEAMEAGDDEKGKLILQRWEEVDQMDEVPEPGSDDDGDDAGADDEDDPFSEGILAGTTAGVIDSMMAEERDEDDIGGYLYDIGFILDSLRSRMFVIFGVFMSVFIGTFAYLYTIGIGQIMDEFIRRVDNEDFAPEQQIEGPIDVVIALHPVEVLIFIVKFSGVLAIIVTLPLLLYYTWPGLQQRGLAPGTGDRRGFLVWGGVLIAGTIGGSLLGFFGAAPLVISYLVNDAVASGMVVSYRIKSFLWVIFFLTFGIGLLFNIPIGMLMLHYADLIRFPTFRRWWRQVVLGIFVAAMFITPSGVLTMVIFAVPIGAAYLFGLAVLWIVTAPATLASAVKERLQAVRR